MIYIAVMHPALCKMKTIFIATSEIYKIREESFDEAKLRGHYKWAEDLVITPEDYRLYFEKQIPEEFRSVLSYYAYEKGHSAGEDEVFLILENLWNELKPCVKAFEERIRKEAK